MDRSIEPKTRRMFLLRAAGAGAIVALTGLLTGRRVAADSHVPKLDPDSPQAKALDYTHQSPKAGQRCDNCQFYQGGDAPWGGCQIFPGNLVSAEGWCKSWIKQGG